MSSFDGEVNTEARCKQYLEDTAKQIFAWQNRSYELVSSYRKIAKQKTE